jgi:hypothetical protein
MATTETLEQALRLLIEDTKRYRQKMDVDLKQSALRVDQALAALSEQSKESVARLEEATAKTQLELDSLAKQVKETTRQMGEQSRRMGTLVEDIVAPDILRILRQVANIPENIEGIINVRQKEFYGGKELNGHPHMLELDALARCGEYALINETKTTLRSEDVKDFVARLAIVRDYFPQLVGKKIIGAVSSLWIDEGLRKQATRQGLLVLALGEGMLQLQNEAGFQPKIF